LVGLKAILQSTGEQSVTALPASIGAAGMDASRSSSSAASAMPEPAAFLPLRSDSLAGSFAPRADVTLAEAIPRLEQRAGQLFQRPGEIGDRRLLGWRHRRLQQSVLAGVIEAAVNAERYGTSLPRSRPEPGNGKRRAALAQDAPAKTRSLVQHRAIANLFRDVGKLATSILDDPPDAASFTPMSYSAAWCRRTQRTS